MLWRSEIQQGPCQIGHGSMRAVSKQDLCATRAIAKISHDGISASSMRAMTGDDLVALSALPHFRVRSAIAGCVQ